MITADQILAGKALAEQASLDMYNKMGRRDQFACGFAWVEVYVDRTNSKQAKELMAAGFKKDYKPRCLSMWNPGGLGVQNVDVKANGADAMATYLKTLGLTAYSCSRLD